VTKRAFGSGEPTPKIQTKYYCFSVAPPRAAFKTSIMASRENRVNASTSMEKWVLAADVPEGLPIYGFFGC
jgi:hypothetical protein